MKKIALLVAMGLVLTAVSAQANSETEASRAQEVKKALAGAADTNNDGALSKAEFVAYGQKHFEKEFARLDKNNDGLITPDEKPSRDKIRHSLNKRVDPQGDEAASTASPE